MLIRCEIKSRLDTLLTKRTMRVAYVSVLNFSPVVRKYLILSNEVGDRVVLI